MKHDVSSAWTRLIKAAASEKVTATIYDFLFISGCDDTPCIGQGCSGCGALHELFTSVRIDNRGNMPSLFTVCTHFTAST